MAPPHQYIIDPICLKDCTVGKFSVSVSAHLFILTVHVSPVVYRCSAFALLTLSPFVSINYPHLSSWTSIISLSGSIEQHKVVREQHCPGRSFLNLFRDHISTDHEQQGTNCWALAHSHFNLYLFRLSRNVSLASYLQTLLLIYPLSSNQTSYLCRSSTIESLVYSSNLRLFNFNALHTRSNIANCNSYYTIAHVDVQIHSHRSITKQYEL